MVAAIETDIETIAEKLCKVERELSDEKGDFSLFAIFDREDGIGRFDVVVAAPWIGDEEKAAIIAIADKITARLTKQEVVMLSRVVVLSPDDDFVRTINARFEAKHKMLRTFNINVNDVPIRDGFIITSSAK